MFTISSREIVYLISQLVTVVIVGILMLRSIHFEYGTNIYMNWQLSIVTMVIALISIIITIRQRCILKLSYIDVACIVYLLYLIVNTCLSNGSFDVLMQYIFVPCIYCIFRLAFSADITVWTLSFKRSLLLSGIFQGVYGIYQLIFESSYSGFMVSGTFLNSSPYSLWIIICYTYASYSVWYDKNQCNRNLSIVNIILIIIILPSTYCRTSWVIFIFITFLIAWMDKKVRVKINYYKKYVPIGIVLLFIFGVGAFYLKKESALGRLFLWSIGLKSYVEAPILGSGIGNYNSIASNVQINYFKDNFNIENKNVYYADSPMSPFNEYINILTEQGIIGLIIFSLIIGLAIYRLANSSYTDFGLALISILMFAFTSYPFSITSFLVVLTVVVSLAASLDMKFKRHNSVILYCLIFICSLSIYNLRFYKISSYNKFQQIFDNDTIIANSANLKLLYAIENDMLFSRDYYFALAYILNRLGDYHKSNDIVTCKLKNSTTPMLFILRARNYEGLNNIGLAEESFLNACYLVPSRFYPLHVLKEFYIKNKMYDKCKVICETIIEMPEKIKTYNSYKIKKEAENSLTIINNNTNDCK